MKKYVDCFLVMLAIFTIMSDVTNGENVVGSVSITIQEGVHGSDGISIVNGEGWSTDGQNLRIGEGGTYQSVPQFYFEIPAELKVPGVVITNATLKIGHQYWDAGGTGYDCMYFQLMHHNYDTGAVSVANGNATNDPNLYTKVGGIVESYGAWTWCEWDIASLLQADIDNGWTYSPFVTRMTDSTGNFISGPIGSSFLGYYGLFRSSECSYSFVPTIEVKYTRPCMEGEVMFFGLPDDVAPEYSDYVSFETYKDSYGQCPYIIFNYVGGPMGDGSCDIVISECGDFPKDIQKIRFNNLSCVETNNNVRLISMWVTPASGPGSESDPGFDKYKKSNYSVQIYPQAGGEASPEPDVRTAGAVRLADVTNVSRKYVMLSIRSNFWGDMGAEYPPIPGTSISSSNIGNISILGYDSIRNCEDVQVLGLSLPEDLQRDCYVNTFDLEKISEEWLKCTVPGEPGCVQTSGGTPTYKIAPVPSGGITVNGSLSEWPVDSEWILLDKLYSGMHPDDIKDARMSLRWDGITDKIYAAVIVDDSNHHFSNTAAYNADLIEIYSQAATDISGNPIGGTGWGVNGDKHFDTAQHYFVGPKLSAGGWSAWADLTTIGSDAGFESAITLDGNKIIYELGLKQFANYGGKGGTATVVANLIAGSKVGFDIIADTVFGSGQFSMISENTFTNKAGDAGQFQQYELVNSLPQQNCGDWGYLASDTTQDCHVNLADFANVALKWLNCNDPTNSSCLHNW